jgi:hypothetical protein
VNAINKDIRDLKYNNDTNREDIASLQTDKIENKNNIEEA